MDFDFWTKTKDPSTGPFGVVVVVTVLTVCNWLWMVYREVYLKLGSPHQSNESSFNVQFANVICGALFTVVGVTLSTMARYATIGIRHERAQAAATPSGSAGATRTKLE